MICNHYVVIIGESGDKWTIVCVHSNCAFMEGDGPERNVPTITSHSTLYASNFRIVDLSSTSLVRIIVLNWEKLVFIISMI